MSRENVEPSGNPRVAQTAVARPNRLATLAWGFAGLVLCGSVIPLEPNLLEEGLIVSLAQRMVHGERLFSDLLSFTGPLPFDFLALLFRLFGEEIMLARVTVAGLTAIAAACAFDHARRAGIGVLAHLAAAVVASAPVVLFPFFSLYFYTTLAVLLCIPAAYASLRSFESVGWGFTAGLLIAGVALCKQTMGGLLAVNLIVAVLFVGGESRLRAGLAIAAGGAFAALLVVGNALVHGELAVLYHSLVVLPLSFTDTFDSPYMNFWPLGSFSEDINSFRFMYVPYMYAVMRSPFADVPTWVVLMTQLLYALPFLALAATLLRRMAGPLEPAVWIHVALLIALTGNLFPRTDWGHLVFVLPGSAIQLLLLALPVRAGEARSVRLATASALMLALCLGSLAAGSTLYGEAGPATFGPRIPFRPVGAAYKSDDVPKVIRFLRQNATPGQPIFVARSEPLLYFATDTTNPTPYSGVVPGMREKQEAVLLEGLEKVRYVVMSEIDQPLYTYYRDELPNVQDYLERYFQLPQRFLGKRNNSWIVVLERGEDRGETLIDFFDLRAQAFAWTRDRQGRVVENHEAPPILGNKHNRRPLPFYLGPRGGGLDYQVELPLDAVFQADLGFRRMIGEGAQQQQQENAVMTVSVGEDGKFERVSGSRVPFARGMSHRWMPVEMDLSKWGGRKVTLRMELVPEAPVLPGNIAWWGSPRVTTRMRSR